MIERINGNDVKGISGGMKVYEVNGMKLLVPQSMDDMDLIDEFLQAVHKNKSILGRRACDFNANCPEYDEEANAFTFKPAVYDKFKQYYGLAEGQIAVNIPKNYILPDKKFFE